MKISEILKEQGLFSTDIKNRFKNNQIKLNDEAIKDKNLDVEDFIMETGDFLFYLIKELPVYNEVLKILGYKSLFGADLIGDFEFFNGFYLLEISKKESFVLMKK